MLAFMQFLLTYSFSQQPGWLHVQFDEANLKRFTFCPNVDTNVHVQAKVAIHLEDLMADRFMLEGMPMVYACQALLAVIQSAWPTQAQDGLDIGVA